MEYSGAGSKKSNSEGEHVAGPGNDDGKGPRAARCRKLRRGDEAPSYSAPPSLCCRGSLCPTSGEGAQMLKY